MYVWERYVLCLLVFMNSEPSRTRVIGDFESLAHVESKLKSSGREVYTLSCCSISSSAACLYLV